MNKPEKNRILQLALRWLVNGFGLWLSALLLDGVDYDNKLWVLAVAALVFSLINAVIRPAVVIFALPAIILTMGLFTLIVNALMIYLTHIFFGPFEISNFGSAVLAAIIVGLVNYIFNMLTSDSKPKDTPPKRNNREVIDIDA